MRIAIFTDSFLPKVDGVVNSIVLFSEYLAKRGHKIAIFCPAPAWRKRITWSFRNVEIVPIGSLPTRYPDLRIAAPTPRSFLKLRKFGADLILLETPGPIGVEGLLGARVLKVPTVGRFNTYFMEPEYLRLVGLEKHKWVSDIIWKYVVSFYNRCDLVVCPSRATINDLRKHKVTKPIKLLVYGINLSFINSVGQEKVEKIRLKYYLTLKN